ncbi:hypothetical protein [Nocardioides sp.]|uniref:hypothetical protein n=1 Tax=Nocardioides sp. TaxID=35761 RepID=UPI003563AE8D
MRGAHLFVVAVVGVMLTAALAMTLLGSLWTSPGWGNCHEAVGALLLQTSCATGRIGP